MINTITYFSFNAKPHEAWMAYAVLPNGQRWGVYSTASTEEEAKAKIVALYKSECNKQWNSLDNKLIEAVKSTQHHFAGKVWMIHKETRDKKRVALTEISLYEKNGYERGGPRSK